MRAPISPRTLALALLLSTAVGACDVADQLTGEGSDDPGPPTVASVQLSRTSVEADVGEAFFLSATAVATTGETLTPADVLWLWTSSNPEVALVVDGLDDDRAEIRAGAEGTATITLSVGDVTADAVVTVRSNLLTIVVENRLLSPVEVTANGTVLGSVEAGSSARAEVEPVASLTVEWDLVRQTTTEGAAVGEPMAGSFGPVANPTGTVTFTVDAVVGEDYYFAPLVTNNTAANLLMGVNMGLQSENRCDCAVPGGGTDVYFGYYRLFTNSNVRGYRFDSGYQPPYIYWENFSGSVDFETGIVRLQANTAPAPPAGVVGEGVGRRRPAGLVPGPLPSAVLRPAPTDRDSGTVVPDDRRRP